MKAKVSELIQEAKKRSYEQAMIRHGREPTVHEVESVFFNAQLAMIAALLCEDDDMLGDYWAGVITVIRGGEQSEAS